MLRFLLYCVFGLSVVALLASIFGTVVLWIIGGLIVLVVVLIVCGCFVLGYFCARYLEQEDVLDEEQEYS